jgi:CubicO group peptidase (beta-lactamase class C family)
LPATYTAAYPKTPTELLKAINNLKLEYTIENKTIFSELGSIVLGELIMKVRNTSLPDAFFQILTIAGLRDTVYRPKTDKYKIAPGGYTDGIAWGTPYSKIAHFLNDTAGNAGLFSTVTDLVIYMQIMLNKGKIPNYSRVFSEEVVSRFLNVTTYKGYKNTRALGWETVPAVNPPCGKKFSPSPDSFGLSDISASYVWADKKRNITIVFLANGAFPARPSSDPAIFQGKLSDAIMTALGF